MIDTWLLSGPDLWPDLDTSLVTCDRLHILTSVACIPLWQLYSVFIHVNYQLYYSAVIYPVIQSVISAVVLIIIYAHCSSARAFSPFTHTLTMVAFWRPWICTSRYWTICFLLCRCSLRSYIMRGAWVPLCSGILISVIFLLLSWFSLFRIQLPFSCHYSSAIIVIVMDMYYCSDWWLL